PMLRQYLQIKEEHKDTILLFRLGDFYEMFFEDAEIASKLLGITLTARNKKNDNPVPLCGVPYHSVQPYIAKLLANGKKVAICDQVEDPKTAKGVVKREVTRIITPGVILDTDNLTAGQNNFLAAISKKDSQYGLAYIDISTGDFKTTEFDSLAALNSELVKIEAKEVLVPRSMCYYSNGTTSCHCERSEAISNGQLSTGDPRLPRLAASHGGQGHVPGTVRCTGPRDDKLSFPADMLITPLDDTRFDPDQVKDMHGATDTANDCPQALPAAGAIWHYLNYTIKDNISHIKEITPYKLNQFMTIDETTKRNLELSHTMMNHSRYGSLIWLLDKTNTAMGARRLRQWMHYPLLDPAEINERLDAVATIKDDFNLSSTLPELLKKVYDLERINAKIVTGNANGRDLVALKDSLRILPKLKTLLNDQKNHLAKIAADIDTAVDLADQIEAHIVDNPPISVRDGYLINEGISKELDELRGISRHGKEFIASLENKERSATGINSLKIKYNKVFGYYIEVTHTHKDKVPDYYIRKQTLVNAERYITPELKEYEEKVLGAEEKIKNIEYELFTELRRSIASNSARITQSANQLAILDALTSLALIANDYNYIKPIVNDGNTIDVKDGRHPIVERINPLERFVPNDVFMDNSADQFLIITGPNMAGKSTVMRQVALIVLMAQMGSFVPAKSATIGVVDRIFTRVGASDALIQGQSTFMVEMIETARILKEATQKSLILIDEIGRGTSTFDGVSIAWAVAEYLHDHIKAKTLFATHYHEMTDLKLTKDGIKNYNIAVKEWNDEIVFLRKLVIGATSRSYGIQVGRLAGLPQEVVDRAKEILANLEKGELNEVGQPKLATSSRGGQSLKTANADQLGLFHQAAPSEIVEKLQSVDTSVITPIEALNILHELKQKL
ncbi:DNA mismatch repair protein MutS, partial [bacterium]|nr:DNA mismatch repair protein MutS [bacterium]